jgi:hypothetical protein
MNTQTKRRSRHFYVLNTLNKTQVNRLANCLELAKIKHGSDKYYGKEYNYYVDNEKEFTAIYNGVGKDVHISHNKPFKSWKVEFDPMLSKTEINIILTKIEEELQK